MNDNSMLTLADKLSDLKDQKSDLMAQLKDLNRQQFKKQLLHSDLLIQSNAQKRIGQSSVKCWAIDFVALSERCDVTGFIATDIEPLR